MNPHREALQGLLKVHKATPVELRTRDLLLEIAFRYQNSALRSSTG